MSKTVRAVVYGRNSSKKQKSIDDQLVECRAVATAEGWTVVEELDDPISASRYATKVRENWARLLELLSTVDVVVLWEPSRGDRTLATWAAFLDACREHGVRIHAVSHQRTYDPRNARDYRSLAEDGVDAAYESDKTSARTRRGKAAAYAAGKPSGKLDYGYRRVYDTNTVPPRYLRQDPHPEQAPVVTGIMADVAAGVTLYRIARRLNDAGVPTARGARAWRPGVVRDIARNPIYRPHPDDPTKGHLMRNGNAYVGTWPPLVDERTWQAVQRVLGPDQAARRRRRDSAPGRVKHLLSASARLLTTPCGAPVMGHPARAGRGAHYLCRDDGCVSVPMEEADEYVIRLVVARLSKKDARRLWVADDAAARKAGEEAARLRGELEAWRGQLDDITVTVDPVSFGRRESALKDAIAEAERRSQPAGAPLAMLQLIEAGEFGVDRVRPTWDLLALPAKREVIAGLFARLTVGPCTERITRWTTPEERLAIVAERIEHEFRSRRVGQSETA